MATPRSTTQLLNRSLLLTRQIARKREEESYGIVQKSALFGRIIDQEIKENHIGHYIVKNLLKSLIRWLPIVLTVSTPEEG